MFDDLVYLWVVCLRFVWFIGSFLMIFTLGVVVLCFTLVVVFNACWLGVFVVILVLVIDFIYGLMRLDVACLCILSFIYLWRFKLWYNLSSLLFLCLCCFFGFCWFEEMCFVNLLVSVWGFVLCIWFSFRLLVCFRCLDVWLFVFDLLKAGLELLFVVVFWTLLMQVVHDFCGFAFDTCFVCDLYIGGLLAFVVSA